MARVSTKIGDVFSVKINDGNRKYFQLISFDLTQLNSDVIRAFKQKHFTNENPDLSEIINGEVEFYAHCVTKLGLKMNCWEKIGNSNDIGNTNQILFRGTSDYGKWIGKEPIKISEKWYVWNINGRFRDVGKLTGENQKAEIGVVINPHSIVHRMKTGEYDFFYPSY